MLVSTLREEEECQQLNSKRKGFREGECQWGSVGTLDYNKLNEGAVRLADNMRSLLVTKIEVVRCITDA